MSLSKVDLAYVACALDSEGSVSFKVRRNNKVPWYFDVRVTITNTNKHWLLWLKSLIGGRVNENCKPKPRSKQGYRLQLDCGYAQKLLKILLHYLRIKKKQALLALRYKPRINGKHQHPFTKHEKLTRSKMYFAMKRLNRRGR